MRSIRYMKPGLALLDVEEPQLVHRDDVKIKISHCAICGTDAHYYAGHLDALATPDRLPLKLGHEATGYVAELGPEATVKGLKKGDRVTYYFKSYCGKCHHCRTGREQFCPNAVSTMSAMSDYIVVREQQVYKLPDSVSMEKGCLAEPISVCLHGIDLANIKPGARVAVSGGGGVGLILMQLAGLSGACDLTLIEPVAEKRELALRMGAKHVIDPKADNVVEAAKAITDGLGFDSVIESSGSPRACQPAYDILGKGGTIIFFALYGTDYAFPVNMWDAFSREATIRFVFQSPYVWPRTIALLERLSLLETMVETVFKPEEYVAGFEAQLTGKPPKVLFAF